MIALPRRVLQSIVPKPITSFLLFPLQTGLGGCPWRIAIASMLMCRTRRVQAQPVIRQLFTLWPSAADLARAEALEQVVRPLGLQRNRSRQLQRFSVRWLGESWDDLRDLPGVGAYVADAVGLICLGCTELESNDVALRSLCNSVMQ